MSIKRIFLIVSIIIGCSFTVLSIPLTKFFAYFDMGASGSCFSDIENYLYEFPLNLFNIINLSVAVLAGIFLYIDLSDERDRKKKENSEKESNDNKSEEWFIKICLHIKFALILHKMPADYKPAFHLLIYLLWMFCSLFLLFSHFALSLSYLLCK